MTTKITDAEALAVLDKLIEATKHMLILDVEAIELRAHIAARLAAGGEFEYIGETNTCDDHAGTTSATFLASEIPPQTSLYRRAAAPTPEGES